MLETSLVLFQRTVSDKVVHNCTLWRENDVLLPSQHGSYLLPEVFRFFRSGIKRLGLLLNTRLTMQNIFFPLDHVVTRYDPLPPLFVCAKR